MKKLKLSALLVSGMITIGVIAATPALVSAQTIAVNSNSVTLQNEKAAINTDVAYVDLCRNNIKTLNQKYKADCKADNTAAILSDKKALRREEANLQLAKAYLKADKAALIDAHSMAIRARVNEVKQDKKDLAASRKQLDKDLAKGDETSAAKNATAVAANQRELKNDRERLSKAVINKNEDILAVNKKMRKANTEFPGTLVAQNTVAKARNEIEK